MKKKLSILLCVFLLSGCAFIKETAQQFKGELIGQHFTINSYDNNGNLISQMKGNSVGIESYNEKSFLDAMEEEENQSSVIQIIIDKKEVLSVGNTVLFVEDGISQITDFGSSDMLNVNNENGTSFMPWQKIANKWKNNVGKQRMILISSQLGVPIAIYEGNEVRVTIPNDLPKTTRITIDGKSIYVHRANYQIIDMDLLK